MGSWSVYCGISNITITEGTRVVLVPLIKNENYYIHRDNNHYCLPIFGKYNDYGSIGNIEEDFNTKIIESFHNCTIQEFCDCLTNYNDEEIESMKDIDYMWIHRDVYDFMVNYHPIGYDRVGDFDMGNQEILKMMGFEYVGENTFDSRYKYTWVMDGIEVQSDGEWCHLINDKTNCGLYDINSFKELFPNKDFSKLENLEKQYTYFLYDDENKRGEMLLTIPFGVDHMYFPLKKQNERMKLLCKDIEDIATKNILDDMYFNNTSMDNKIKPFVKEYINLLMDDDFCKRCADLVTLWKNMYVGSYNLKSYQLYITPQCGEHKIHQAILEEFTKINKNYINTEDDE